MRILSRRHVRGLIIQTTSSDVRVSSASCNERSTGFVRVAVRRDARGRNAVRRWWSSYGVRRDGPDPRWHPHRPDGGNQIIKSRVRAADHRRLPGRRRRRRRRQLLLRLHHLQFAHHLRVLLQQPGELAPSGLGFHLDLLDPLPRSARTVERCLRRRVLRAALARQSVQVGAVAEDRVRVHVVYNEAASTSAICEI